ncbi:UvrD-helicase domain-containing protein [Marinobacterium nitratireducens]|uniref:UvrD-helicase domain-containing protein n=1 Tax=Marinobacterium nitratireducens TaxID=518897 RepID=UPI00166EA21E|nr:UvrD-helicase domain-containing protein [Marinobacterium nitratireducens]
MTTSKPTARISSLFGRRRLELCSDGLRILDADSRLISWTELARQAQLEPGLLFRHLRLTGGDTRLNWLPRWRRRFWRLYRQQLQLHCRPLMERELQHIESELQRVYPRQSRWRALSGRAQQVLQRFHDLPFDDDPLLRRLRLVAAADEGLLARYREHFVEQRQNQFRDIFEKVERQPLTEAQQRACIVDDDRNLVLAGAGSGKTSTLIARTAYLVASGQARPDEILLLAYGREAAREMRERLQQRLGIDVPATTFHALGQRIIKTVDGERPAISNLASEGRALDRWVAAQLETLLVDPGFCRDLAHYCKHFRRPAVDLDGVEEPEALRALLSKTRVLDSLAVLLTQALRRYRTAALDRAALEARLAQSPQPDHARATMALLEPLLERYSDALAASGEIDFDDMIRLACQALVQGRFRPRWRFILVDEFQDLSAPRADLIRALLGAVPDASLFAVGDDWQSIYRFSGSDLRLTTDFAACFGPATLSALDLTFRFNDRINEVASGFVLRNPSQLPKTLATLRHSDAPAVTLVGHVRGEEDAALTGLLGALAREAAPQSRVLLLSRHRFRLPEADRLAMLARSCSGLQLEAQTCHGAKGREADYVILLGLDQGTWGFPQAQSEQPLLEALLAPADRFEHAEERRLFYVALTRARSHVYLLCDRAAPSVFARELLEQGYPVNREGL